MEPVYIILCRWGCEWDGQSLYQTTSKPLFDYVKDTYFVEGPSFSDFPEDLKENIRARYELQKRTDPEITQESLNEDMDLAEAMEWLDSYGDDYNKFPVVLAGTTDLTLSWNW